MPEDRREALIERLLQNEEVKKAYEAKLKEDPSLENDEPRRLEFLQEQLQAIGGPARAVRRRRRWRLTSAPDPSATAVVAHPDAATGRILVVEDDVAIAELIELYLDKEGLESTCVASAEAAESALRHLVFHLLILDINLPGRDGISVPDRVSRPSLYPGDHRVGARLRRGQGARPGGSARTTS